MLKIAGVCGPTTQASREAALAVSLGYDAALVSLGALRDSPNAALVEHCRTHMRNLEVRNLGRGSHFVQEDQPEAIGDAIRDWRSRVLAA